MKPTLIDNFRSLLETEDISSVKQNAKYLIVEYQKWSEKEKVEQEEAWKQSEPAEGEHFTYIKTPEDAVWEQLLIQYETKVKDWSKKIAQEQLGNLLKKKEVLVQLENLMRNQDQLIGKSFHDFNQLNEKWKSIGEVPKDHYQKINSDYQRLREEFFYTISIYKELKDYDLKVNQKRKEELILKAKVLESEISIKECEQSVRQLQREWNETGPSSKETYKEMGDTFFTAIRSVYAKIQRHYDDLKVDMEKNLILKKALLEQVKLLMSAEITQHTEWIKKTDEVIAMQEKWKSIGFAEKKEGELVWNEFRSLCDKFFEEKNNYYAQRKEEFNRIKKIKETLIEKARELQHNTNWKETTQGFLQLQKDWKSAGSTFQKDEQKLWQQFKSACDVFFQKKKEYFHSQEAEQEMNLQHKLKLIDELKAFEPQEDTKENIRLLKNFNASWNAIGFVPRKNMEEVNNTYETLVHEKFGIQRRSEQTDHDTSYEEKIELIKNAPNSDELMERESDSLRKKIEKLQKQVIQYENNLGFFAKSSGSSKIKEEVQDKIKATEFEIKEIKKQLELLY